MIQMPSRHIQGFSLIQISILLAVAGIILAASLPGGESASEDAKAMVTLTRMKAIEEATQKFMLVNMRRPCPASGTDPANDTDFGQEIGVAGACATADFPAGSVAANAVAGTVPVRALNLPDEYALDGYGRRFMYVVDKNATGTTTCRTHQSQETKGTIPVLSDATTLNEYVMWALISYGKDGHGAFSGTGSTIANRINTYTSDAKTLINAFVDSSFGTAFTGQVVKANVQAGFDDKVWFHETTKNTCCIGTRCSQGFRINTNAVGAVEPIAGTQIATGDINGDGIKDLVYANDTATSNHVKVILGTQTGWPVAPTAVTGSTAATYTINNDESATAPYFGSALAVGDATGDGLDDILIAALGYTYFVHGLATATPNSSNPNVYNISSLKTSLKAVRFRTGGALPGAVAFGNINGDSYKDLVFASTMYSSAVFVQYGKANASWSAGTVSLVTAPGCGSYLNGFCMTSASLTLWCGGYNALAVANMNPGVDSIDDIICGGPSTFTNAGSVSLIYGRAAGWPGADPPVFAVDTAVTTLNSGTYFTSTVAGDTALGQALDVADTNIDGYPDIVVASDRRIFGISGQAANYAAGAININVAVAPNQFRINTFANRPAAFIPSGTNNALRLADINGDSLPDILFSTQGSSYEMGTAPRAAGMVYVLYQPTQAIGWGSDGFQANWRATPLTLFGANPNEYQYLDGVEGFLIEGDTGDAINTIRAADINKDYKTDILISAPGDGGNSAGSVYVIYGRDATPWKSRIHATTYNPYINLDDINN